MFTRSHSLKGIASLGSTTIAIILLYGCSGAGFGPTESRGTTPDLVVAPPSVSDSGPVAGTQFTMWATVRNVGEGASAATRLRYYRSPDATISTADTEVGTVAVTGLAASNSARESVDVTAPTAAGTYYYGACVDAVTDESDTTNNCSSSVRVTAREPEPGEPDLVVAAPSVSDSGPIAGATFTLLATVRNAGEGAPAATTLRYYRSPDATITTSDTEVGTDEVAGLAAAGSSSQSVDLTAPATSGTYYYGACVDTVTNESDTTNNCSASVQVTVPESKYPDLVVGLPSVSDSGPAAGATFTLSATVRNDGEGSSEATTLRFYRSTDRAITTTDTQVGTAAVAGLSASGSRSESVELTAPATPGTYYYGACVDAVAEESDTTNNCSASVEVNVPEPTNPDLAVRSLSVSDSGPVVEAQFTLSATVRNGGNGASATTTLRFYQSTDRAITATDTQVDTAAVAGLSASGSRGVSVELTAPSTAGTYYYGACVDAVADESDATNNCSASMEVNVLETLEQTQGSPDLVVGSPSVSDSGPAAGATFTLSATVSNDGDGESETTTLRYYQSTDSAITTTDTAVGTDAVGVLGASGSSSESVDLAAPSSPGTYYYGACVVAVADESDTTNNCSTSVPVTVPEPERHADLVVVSPSVSDTGPVAGAAFTLSATVRNGGDGASAATTLRFYRSTDRAITTTDTQVGTAAVAGLSASGSRSESVELTAPSTPGTYYYGACVDAVADESDTTNNCSASVEVRVPEPTNPDLAVASLSASDSGPVVEARFALSATVRNGGNGASPATTLRFYQSTDRAITATDTQVGTAAVAGLSASGSRGVSVELTAPSTAGTYYYGACVDAVAEESDTTNNCSASMEVSVLETLEQTQGSPDLVVASPSVSNSDPAAGEAFTLSATVSNDGDGESETTTLRYYRSTDSTISTSDAQEDTDAVEGLVASGTGSVSTDLTAPSTPGTYYYGACVDAVTDESDTTNNCSASVQVTVPQVQPDLVVGSPSVDDNSPAAGDTFTLSVTVENDGDGASPATTLRYYRSTDSTITTSDTAEGTDAVEGLAASGTSSESTVLTAPSTPGTYYYGACVDTVTGESDATNNCSTSVSVVVPESTLQGGPDLVLSGLDGSANGDRNGAVSPRFLIVVVTDINIHPGDTFYMGVSVQNSGDAPAGATTMRFYQSSDSTISTSDTQVGTDEVTALGVSQRVNGSTDVTAPSPGTYYYGACVDAVPGETDTTNNCIGALKLDVVDPNLPDLILPPPSVSDRFVSAGETFTLTAHVRNFGTTSQATSQATTLRYYQSTDSWISTSDTEVGTDAIPALPAYRRSTQSVDLTAPSLSGTYYYGACVDAVANEADTTNNCSYDTSIVVQ